MKTSLIALPPPPSSVKQLHPFVHVSNDLCSQILHALNAGWVNSRCAA
jgi:hypothetical protein